MVIIGLPDFLYDVWMEKVFIIVVVVVTNLTILLGASRYSRLVDILSLRVWLCVTLVDPLEVLFNTLSV